MLRADAQDLERDGAVPLQLAHAQVDLCWRWGQPEMRQCQTNANQTAKCAKRIASGCQLTPLGQGGRTVLFEDVASAEVAIVVKVIVGRGVDGGEFLQGLDVPEFRHCPFPSSERLV